MSAPTGISLRPYQQEAVDAVLSAADRGVTRSLIALPTGAGKTIVAAELVRRRGGTALFLAHRDELLQQAAEKLRMAMPERGLEMGLVKAGRDDARAPMVLGSMQTLSRRARLARFPQQFETVIVDEAHRSMADGYQRILSHVSESPLIVGLTATPERNDHRHLADMWQEVVYRKTLLEMIAAGYLCDLRAVRVALDVNLDGVAQSHGDFSAGELGDALANANAPAHVCRAYRRHADGRKALLFAPTVELAHEMAATFTADGVPAEAIDASTPGEQRREALARFRDGRTRLLSAVDIFTEGYDEPSIACVILCRPTSSRIRFCQAVGRGCRPHPSKEDCLILDVTGQSKRLSLIGLPRLFGLRREPAAGETVMDAVARESHERDSTRQDAPSGRLIAEAVDLFSAMPKRRKLHWLHVDGRYVLSLGSGSLELRPGLEERFTVVQAHGGRERELATGVSLEYAHGIAEEYVHRAGVERLADPSAGWRRTAPGPKQLALLAQFGIDVPKGTTKGEASDMISAALARKRARRSPTLA